MEMKPVTSSNIESIGHDGDVMHVKYKSGYSYTHSGVTPEKYKEIIGRASIGKAMHVFKTHNPGTLIK